MTEIILCDISKYQGAVNFVKMEDAGAKGVIIRKQVGYKTDPRFWENFEAAKLTNLKVTIYGVPFLTWDIDRQIDTLIEGLVPGDLDFPPEGDIERRHIYGRQYAIGEVLQYMHGVEAWWGAATFYTAKFVWEEMYSNKHGWVDDWDLHVANYTTADYPHYIPIGWERDAGGVIVPKDKRFGIWQYSADGNYMGNAYGCESRDVDLNKMMQWYWDKWINDIIIPTPELPADALTQLWVQGLAHGWELVQ